jgi:hypothetical protein
MLEERYPDAKKVVLVMDNLNTHNTASLYEAYEAFPPEEARRQAGYGLKCILPLNTGAGWTLQRLN